MTYLGIDIGGTKIASARLDRTGAPEVLAPVPTPGDYPTLLERLIELAAAVSSACGEPVTHIGVGVPGTVSAQAVTWVPNLAYLDGRDLAGDLRRQLGLGTSAHVIVANDAQFALLGEVWLGAAGGASTAVLLSAGTGIGGAILLDGRIARGAHGSAGAFGWLNLDWRESPDPQQQHGYTERHASGTALDARTRAAGLGESAVDLVRRARAGEERALALVQEVANLLGVACASIASIIDPEMLIFSGGLADAFDLFEQPLRAAMRAHSSPSVCETTVVVSQLGSRAAAYGALRGAMLQHRMWR